MADIVPQICGKNDVYIPDRGCTDCEQVEQRVAALEEWKPEIEAEVDTKLEASDITAGDNITIESVGDRGIRISSTGGGGGSMTKAEILAALGYEETTISMTDTDGNDHEWTVLVAIQTP